MMDRPERALVVTPHADDAEIGCGGTVAGWIAGGSKVFYVLCTNGDKGTSDPDMTSKRLAEIREREQAEAASVLGIEKVVISQSTPTARWRTPPSSGVTWCMRSASSGRTLY